MLGKWGMGHGAWGMGWNGMDKAFDYISMK